MNCKRFLEIVTEGNERYYFPLMQIKRLTIKKRTVQIVVHSDECCDGKRYDIDDVSNIDRIAKIMDNYGI